MEMIKVNDRVTVNDSIWDIRSEIGTVITVYDFDTNKAVVKLDSGRFVKVSVESLTKIEAQETKEPTITREQFRKVAETMFDPKEYTDSNGETVNGSIMIALTAVLICAKLEKKLFGEIAEERK